MRLAFILPSDAERQKIGRCQEQVVEMRPDQIKYLEHLLRPWGIFGRPDGIALTARAIKKTLSNKP